MISLLGVRKEYGGRTILDGVDLDVSRGESVAIVGASGSGKSTLLGILGLLLTPDSGAYRLDGDDVLGLGGTARARLRGAALGFVFQQFHLIRTNDVAANVEVPLAYAGVAAQQREALVASTLELVGMKDAASRDVRTLSGGEQQRVALARALVRDPAVLLCDEPTGNLDPANAETVIELIAQHATRGNAVVVITHDAAVARRLSRRLELVDGKLRDGS